jgi:large subunit ribosomal protein L13
LNSEAEVMSTYFPSGKDLAENRKWFVVDATDKTLGRLSTEIAMILMGKNKPTWTPFLDVGDHVVVINAKHIKIKGAKADSKAYYRHSGYPGGLKTIPYKRMLEEKPHHIVKFAVQRMLPKTKLGRAMFKKLNVYAGAEHPHAAQKPEPIEINTF